MKLIHGDSARRARTRAATGCVSDHGRAVPAVTIEGLLYAASDIAGNGDNKRWCLGASGLGATDGQREPCSIWPALAERGGKQMNEFLIEVCGFHARYGGVAPVTAG